MGSAIHPAYGEVSGKIGAVSEVIPQKDGSFLITLEMEDSGAVYTAKTVGESVEGLIPYRDIEQARKTLVGRKFFFLKDNLLSDDSNTGAHRSVSIPRYSALEVMDALPGSSTKTPVRIVLRTPGGETGYIELNLSGTNVPRSARNQNRFEDYFSIEDPKDWHPDIHEHIAGKRVKKGMTPTQARLSLGSPYTVETVATPTGLQEKWFYPYGDMLFFEDGKLKESGKTVDEE